MSQKSHSSIHSIYYTACVSFCKRRLELFYISLEREISYYCFDYEYEIDVYINYQSQFENIKIEIKIMIIVLAKQAL